MRCQDGGSWSRHHTYVRNHWVYHCASHQEPGEIRMETNPEKVNEAMAVNWRMTPQHLANTACKKFRTASWQHFVIVFSFQTLNTELSVKELQAWAEITLMTLQQDSFLHAWQNSLHSWRRYYTPVFRNNTFFCNMKRSLCVLECAFKPSKPF